MGEATFICGHARTPDAYRNPRGRLVCRRCERARQRRARRTAALCARHMLIPADVGVALVVHVLAAKLAPPTEPRVMGSAEALAQWRREHPDWPAG